MWLYNDNHKKLEFLPYYKDRSIESVLSSGDKTLNFSYPIEKAQNIKEEYYIRTKTDEFVVKETKTNGQYVDVIATLNVEELEGTLFTHFKTTYATIEESLNEILADTNWRVGICEITKRRTIEGTLKSAWELISSCISTYNVEIEFDTIHKIINVYNRIGSDKGVFMIDGFNLKELEIQSNSYNFYTRLVPIGKDGLTIESINNDKNYIENYQYSKKVKTYYWKDERYTIVNDLLEDSIIKLDEMSQPTKAYEVYISDLAKMNKKYKIYEFGLGDTILLVSKSKNTRLKERIVKYIEYPENPENNKVELSTTKVTLENIQKKFLETSTTVSNITTSAGTVSNTSIAGLDNLIKEIDNKVDKIIGKQLSTEDFTSELKNKLESLKAENWITIADEILTTNESYLIYDTDINNNDFDCDKLIIVLEVPKVTTNVNLNILNSITYSDTSLESDNIIKTVDAFSTANKTYLLYEIEKTNILTCRYSKGVSNSALTENGAGYKLSNINLNAIQIRTDSSDSVIPINTIVKVLGRK